MVIVISSLLEPLKLRTGSQQGSSLRLPSPSWYPNHKEVFRLDHFLSVAPQLWASPALSEIPDSEKHWFMGLGDQGQSLWVGTTLPFRAQGRLEMSLSVRGVGKTEFSHF